jgi:hypothetical protein
VRTADAVAQALGGLGVLGARVVQLQLQQRNLRSAATRTYTTVSTPHCSRAAL